MVKLVGWILIAVSLARGISHLAAALPDSDAAQLLHLLFNSPRTAPGLVESLVEFTTSTEFHVTVAFGFGGAVLRGMAQWGQQVLATRGAMGEKEYLRAQLIRHRLAAAGAHADRSGEDTVLASKGLDGLDDYYTDFLPSLVSAMVIPLGLGVWILLHDWISAAVLVLTIPLIPLFMILIGRYTEHRVDEAASGLNKLSHHLLELARGLPVLVGLRRAGMQRKSLQQVSDSYQRTTMNTLKAAFMSGMALELISTLSVAVIAVFIGVRLVNGSMELYAGIMVLTLAAEVYLPFRDIGSAFHASEDGVAALKRAKAQIRQPVPKPMATLLDTAAAPSDDAVELHNVTIAYQALHKIEEKPDREQRYLTPEQYAQAKQLAAAEMSSDTGQLPVYAAETLDPVVEACSMRLLPGQYTVLGDASGSGKSTVLKAMAGLLTDSEATFTGATTGLATRPVAYLGQHPTFIGETVAAELHLVSRSSAAQNTDEPTVLATQNAVVSMGLEHAGLAGFEHRRIDDLSPGERRRLGFARVLTRLMTAAATNRTDTTWLVLLDEPTAHLDAHSATLIRSVLHNLAHGRLPDGSNLATIVLVASHDPEIHAACHQLIGQPANQFAASVETSHPAPTTTLDDQPTPRTSTKTTVRLRDWLRFLPLNDAKFIGGIAWAAAALLSAALLAALSGWLIVQASYEPPILYLLAVIVGVRFFGIGRAVFRYVERLAVHDAVLAWANRIRLRVWDSLGSQATQWNSLTRSGGTLSVLISDVDQLRDAVPRVIVPIPAAVITWAIATGIIGFMAPGSWWPAALAGAAAFIIVPAIVQLVEARTSAQLADHRSWLVSAASRLFTAAPDLAGNGMSAHAAEHFVATDYRNAAPLKRNTVAAGLGEGLTSLIAGWAAVQTMWVAITNGISAPNTALAVMLMLAMAEPFGMFSQATQESRILNHQLGKLLPLLQQSPNRSLEWVVVEPTAAHGLDALELNAVTVAYEDGPPVLNQLSLRAARGDFVVVTGPSGSGKSTLLAVLLGFLAPQSGTYRLAAQQTDPVAALQQVAWCPQEAYLFDSTLRANLALARDPAQRPTDDELLAVLDTVGLTAWLDSSPAGLDTRLGPSGHFISGGQRQRVAVARALLADAQVVLLDEPTAHLGADEAAELLDDLKLALRDSIVVMVTHDQRFATAGHTLQLS